MESGSIRGSVMLVRYPMSELRQYRPPILDWISPKSSWLSMWSADCFDIQAELIM